MGYEIKMFVGAVAENDYTGGPKWFRVIAEVDLCKVGDFLSIVNEPKEGTPVYLYGLDGNTQFTQDSYGDTLVAMDPQAVLRSLKVADKRDPYRRFKVAIALLQSILKNFSGNERIGVVLYGH